MRESQPRSRSAPHISASRHRDDAFFAIQSGLSQTDHTIDSEQWRAPKCRHYVIGPTGIGKSWLAQALAQKACRDGYSVWYRPLPKLFRELMVARADGSLGRVLETIARVDVLVVDDFAMAPLNEQERRDFLEICDDRYNRRSTILTGQLPIEKWHAQIGDPTLADSILDRVVHNAYRIELSGESIRRKKGRGFSDGRPGGGA